MSTERTHQRSPSLFAAAGVMLALSLLLFWLPILGPLIAGVIGGRMAGTVGRALALAVLPAIAMAVLIVLGLAAFDLPVLGTVVGIGVFIVVLVQDLPLLAGAAFGGANAR
jgi:hypothetical protein